MLLLFIYDLYLCNVKVSPGVQHVPLQFAGAAGEEQLICSGHRHLAEALRDAQSLTLVSLELEVGLTDTPDLILARRPVL